MIYGEARVAGGYASVHTYVLQRDGWKCRCCGRRNHLHVHHIIFRSNQGSDDSSNLVALCMGCHDKVHGKVLGQKITILAKSGDTKDAPDANAGLKFIREERENK